MMSSYNSAAYRLWICISNTVFCIRGWCQSTSQHQAGCGGSWWLCSKCTPPPNLSVSDSPEVNFFKWIARTDQTLASLSKAFKQWYVENGLLLFWWLCHFGWKYQGWGICKISARYNIWHGPPPLAGTPSISPRICSGSSTPAYFIQIEIFHPPLECFQLSAWNISVKSSFTSLEFPTSSEIDIAWP